MFVAVHRIHWHNFKVEPELLYLNPNFISHMTRNMYELKSGGEHVDHTNLRTADGYDYKVFETPEEIIRLIGEQEKANA